MRTKMLTVTAAVALAVGIAGGAGAAQPTIEHFSCSGIDEEFSALLSDECGFEVTVFVRERTTARTYADGSERDTTTFRATFSSPTTSLYEKDTYQFYFDADQETLRFTGVPFRIQDADGNVIFKDRGLVVFDTEGHVLTEHGPHPSLHEEGEPFGICT